MSCPVCGTDGGVALVHFAAIPVFCNLLCPTREAALAVPKGEIDLRFCHVCGHVHNRSFDPAPLAYSPDYEASLQGSAVFRDYADALARHLVERYGLKGRSVIEIGCGQGDFLKMLRHHGAGPCTGFDPSYAGGERDEHITIHRDHFTTRHALMPADLVVSRQVLEHLDEPAALVAGLRSAIGERDAAVFVEVPNQLHVTRGLGIWDIIYEHPSYYSASSLAALFTAGGFAVEDVYETFGDQFLCAEMRPGKATAPLAPPRPVEAAQDFSHRFHAHLAAWREALARLAAQGRTVAIWGSGSKGTMFLNLTAATGAVSVAVDVNRRKQGMFVPGTGHPIVAPAALTDLPPAMVLVMNPLYCAEIEAELRRLGLSAAIIPVGGAAPAAEIG